MIKNYSDFVTELNAFSELLKTTTTHHVEYIRTLGSLQKQLRESSQELLADMEAELTFQVDAERLETIRYLTSYAALAVNLEKTCKGFHQIFKQHINDTNKTLGAFSSHWGSYVETFSVEYIQNYLRKEKETHTAYQKFKKHYRKGLKFEIDLLALSDTHAYVVEVKNQLKPEVFEQISTILSKIKENVSEVNGLKLQAIVLCVHIPPETLKYIPEELNLWILRYKGLDAESPEDDFEWINVDGGQIT